MTIRQKLNGILNEMEFFLFGEKSKHISIIAFSQINKQDVQKSSETKALYSFEPEIISESEERERITALAQRDFLIKSYGMLEQIYVAMKRNGMLRPADERKYGLYGRLRLQASTNHSTCSASHKPHHRQNGHLDATQPAAEQCLQCLFRENEVTISLSMGTLLISENLIQIQIRFYVTNFYAFYI